MTAKSLSWATFALLIAGSVPFVSSSEASAATVSATSYNPPPGGNPTPIPLCGTCNVKPTQEYQKAYAIDRNTLCPPEEPYRVTMRLSSKIICMNGSYWICEDTSSMACSVYAERPECPQDSCAR